MARIRSVHPDALKSDKLALASAEAERCYWRLLPLCDDDGRAEDDPVIIAADAFKKNEEVVGRIVNEWLEELEQLGLIVRYEVDGKRYLVVTRWHDYQKPQKKTDSKLPPPPENHQRPTPPVQPSSDTSTRPVPDRCGTEKEVGEGDGEGLGVLSVESQRSESLVLVPVDVSPAATTGGGDVVVVFNEWQQATGHHQAKLDDNRRRLIKNALKNYPIHDVIDACWGWRNSPHHRGENERHTVYDGLHVLLKNAEQIEKFRDLRRNGPPMIRSKSEHASDEWLAMSRRAGLA